jgi:NAD(P)-dependent dehydrogenase (short-subunit alcohol dehydrogenase family)
VTVVHPGLTITERSPAMFAALAEREARFGAGTSIGRLTTADEVADVVVFLCPPRSVAITRDAVATGGGAPGPIHC